MQYARAELGDQEVRDNTKIVGWAKYTIGGWIGTYFTNAHTIPWCGLYVATMLKKAGQLIIGDKSLGALNWATWGQKVEVGKASIGTLLVFSRPGGGHVGFYVGEDATAYYVLGGNESDAVRIERIAKNRCVALRWPVGPAPIPAPVMMAANGTPISTNEA